MSFKSAVKEHLPFVVPVYHWFRLLPRKLSLLVRGRESVFTHRFERGGWESEESISGVGSEKDVTRAIQREIPIVVRELGARSFLDVPCGDFNWMQDVDLGVERYIGADIVEALIAENRRRYAREGREFLKLDLVRDALPKVDIVFCRDCLIHLSFADIRGALGNIKRSGSRYLLTTTHVDRDRNRDILTGDFRPINLQVAPFHFPEPLLLIDEQWPDIADKRLGLWAVEDIPV